MKLIGLLGGVGWETTAIYYRLLNEYVQRDLGGHHSARILIHSLDSGDIESHRRAGNWDEIGHILGEAAGALKAGGAEFIILATNTMHRIADHISTVSDLELLHIADPVGAKLRADGFTRVALLGTRHTMESDFYPNVLETRYGLSVITPEPDERAEVQRIISDELCHGIIRAESEFFVGELVRKLHARGAEAVILGCSHITTIIPPECDIIPVYDTTRLHARAAVRHALGDRP
ncbi:aspartate/glutamate racemase family protein [Hoeflea sp. Naph1]|jgi:aspartate racemase|uniref:aspartate/glutamate racemase family protein n=1 Tax=Hoeflea sp. Naph1 TaxID=3388653 RepID=UPI00398FDB7E